MSINRRLFPRTQTAWAWYNMGHLRGVEQTRKAARNAAAENCAVPWERCKAYMEVHKVHVSKYRVEPSP
jgi:hypothetical protein